MAATNAIHKRRSLILHTEIGFHPSTHRSEAAKPHKSTSQSQCSTSAMGL